MAEPNRFQKLVAQAKQRITEISPDDARREMEGGDAVLIDVREESDWRQGHAGGARHLSRGEIELEIEEQIPDVKNRSFVIAAAAAVLRSSRRVCRGWDMRTSVQWPEASEPGKEQGFRVQLIRQGVSTTPRSGSRGGRYDSVGS